MAEQCLRRYETDEFAVAVQRGGPSAEPTLFDVSDHRLFADLHEARVCPNAFIVLGHQRWGAIAEAARGSAGQG